MALNKQKENHVTHLFEDRWGRSGLRVFLCWKRLLRFISMYVQFRGGITIIYAEAVRGLFPCLMMLSLSLSGEVICNCLIQERSHILCYLINCLKIGLRRCFFLTVYKSCTFKYLMSCLCFLICWEMILLNFLDLKPVHMFMSTF